MQLVPWSSTGGTEAPQHLFRVDSGCADAASCTGVSAVHRLADGSVAVERAPKGKIAASFGGPEALLVGRVEP